MKSLKVSYFIIAFALLATGNLLLGDRITVAQQTSAESEQCIRCHVEVFNTGQRQKFIHSPFFERQCQICHQEKAATSTSPATNNLVSGLLVDQQPLWRKQQLLGGEQRLQAHVIPLNSLMLNAIYRFRLQVCGNTAFDDVL